MHKRTGVTPNRVGLLVEAMLQMKVIRECLPDQPKMGRPRIPLEIDPVGRHILGLAIVPSGIEITQMSLTGEVIGDAVSKAVSTPSKVTQIAAALLTSNIRKGVLAVGVTSTGFVDPIHKKILFSSALPGRGVESLKPVFDATGGTRAVLGNDMHALAARWLLTHRAEQRQDVLLVWFTDGRLGSALLVNGQPNRGCTTGGNELGHTRFPDIETAECYCGQTGCLERIVSSDFLRRQLGESSAAGPDALAQRISRFKSIDRDRGLSRLIQLFALGLSNAVNFLRVHRLVLVSPYSPNAAFTAELLKQTKDMVLPALRDRLAIDLWDQPSTASAENSAWLALADLLYGGWDAMGGHSEDHASNGAAAD